MYPNDRDNKDSKKINNRRYKKNLTHIFPKCQNFT